MVSAEKRRRKIAVWLVLIAVTEPRASVHKGAAWNHKEDAKNVNWASAGSQQLQRHTGLLLRGETSPQQEEKKGGEERKRSRGSKIEKEKKSNQGTEIVQNFTETDEEKRGCIPCRTLENKHNPARGYTKAASPFFVLWSKTLKSSLQT